MRKIKIIDDKDVENIPSEKLLYIGHRAANMVDPAPFPGSEMKCGVCGLPVYCSTINEHIWGRPGTTIRCLECAAAGYDPHKDMIVTSKKSHDAVMKKIRERSQ